jgi:hypothetical protein
MTGATLYPLEPLFQNKAQASAFLFPQRHGPEIAGVVVGVSRDLYYKPKNESEGDENAE